MRSQGSTDMTSEDRSGILTQVAPNLGPIFWQQINGSDGVVRHIQWQARIEGRTNSEFFDNPSKEY
jgi:cellobiose dehydrogenase (acceptor)